MLSVLRANWVIGKKTWCPSWRVAPRPKASLQCEREIQPYIEGSSISEIPQFCNWQWQLQVLARIWVFQWLTKLESCSSIVAMGAAQTTQGSHALCVRVPLRYCDCVQMRSAHLVRVLRWSLHHVSFEPKEPKGGQLDSSDLLAAKWLLGRHLKHCLKENLTWS